MGKRIYTYLPPVPPAREQDYQLAYEALQGDTDAWELLYQEAFPLVLHAVRKFDCQHFFAPHDHEDITEEAFAKCYEQLERYRGLSRFWRWVFGYTKNIIHNRRRRQHTVRRNRYLLEIAAKADAIGRDPLHILIRLERDQLLWNAFSQLSLPDQTILRQRLFFNTPPRELAKELQLTRKQVLQHYENALIAVRCHYLRLYS